MKKKAEAKRRADARRAAAARRRAAKNKMIPLNKKNIQLTPLDQNQFATAALGVAMPMPKNCGCNKAQVESKSEDSTPVNAEALAQTDFNDCALY